jgi:hypothetical protein
MRTDEVRTERRSRTSVRACWLHLGATPWRPLWAGLPRTRSLPAEQPFALRTWALMDWRRWPVGSFWTLAVSRVAPLWGPLWGPSGVVPGRMWPSYPGWRSRFCSLHPGPAESDPAGVVVGVAVGVRTPTFHRSRAGLTLSGSDLISLTLIKLLKIRNLKLIDQIQFQAFQQ